MFGYRHDLYLPEKSGMHPHDWLAIPHLVGVTATHPRRPTAQAERGQAARDPANSCKVLAM